MKPCKTAFDSSQFCRSRFVTITQKTSSCIVHNLKVNVDPIQTIKGTMALIHNHSIRGSLAVAHMPLNFRECILKHNYLSSFLWLLLIFSRWNQDATHNLLCAEFKNGAFAALFTEGFSAGAVRLRFTTVTTGDECSDNNLTKAMSNQVSSCLSLADLLIKSAWQLLPFSCTIISGADLLCLHKYTLERWLRRRISVFQACHYAGLSTGINNRCFLLVSKSKSGDVTQKYGAKEIKIKIMTVKTGSSQHV